MRKLAWWFCMFGMTLRRALYRPVFLLFLLIFPLGMGVLHQVEKRDSGRIAVALCPGTDAWNQALAERLESEESRSFFFYPCGTEEEAKKALSHVGVKEENFTKSPFELSGGQKKRVAIAGVLAMNPQWQRKLYQKRYFLNCSRCMGGNCWRTMGKMERHSRR